MHEVAIRILAGAAVREAARSDRAAEPILSMAEDHYIRIFLRLTEGARRADEALGSIGYAWATGEGGVATGPDRPSTGEPWAGPLWLGPLHEPRLLEAMAADTSVPRSKRLERLLGLWREEAPLPPLMVDANRVASRLKLSSPRLEGVLEVLRSKGYSAGRAHTNPVGIKTDAPMEEVERAFIDLASKG